MRSEAMARAQVTEAKVKGWISNYITKTYLGDSQDVENPASIDFCAYFVKTYDSRKDLLKGKFTKIESDICRLTGWAPPGRVARVPDADPDDIPEFYAAPWQLGFTEAHSVKGKSKLIHILDIVDGFLKKPYNSKTEPLQVIFGPGSQVGSEVPDWSMVLSVGMGKASACRMILEAVAELNLEPAHLALIAPTVKALLRMRCTYDPAPTEEEQLTRAMSVKNQVTERPRPDPLMWAGRWSQVLGKQGVDFASAIDDRIKSFNADRSEGFGILDYEVSFIKAYRHQSPKFVEILEGHWQNYKVQESAVPPKRLAMADLSPDTKVKRCEKNNGLWQKILTWTAEANVIWLSREIGSFLRSIKDTQRAGKKINLRTNAKNFRSKVDNHLSHDEVCLFTYFIPEFQRHTTPEQFQDLYARMTKGYFDKELNEKVKVMDPELSALDFRFLSMITGQALRSTVGGPRSTVGELEEKAERNELDLFAAKLERETNLWVNHQRALKVHTAQEREERRRAAKDLDAEITCTANEFCALHAPAKKLSEDGVLPYIAEAVSAWAESEKISKDGLHTVFFVRLDALGTKFFANLNPAVRIVSDYISKDPARSAAVFIAPNTGKDDAPYNEQSIEQAMEETEDILKQDQWQLRVRRGSLVVEEGSIGGARSKRPGYAVAFLVVSDARDAKTNQLVSDFAKSYLFKRQRPVADLEVLGQQDYLNPCAPLVRSTDGARSLSKAQRSKQWYTGCAFWNGLRSSVLCQMNLDASHGVAWVDLLPYDDKLIHSVIMARTQRAAKVPVQMVISTVRPP